MMWQSMPIGNTNYNHQPLANNLELQAGWRLQVYSTVMRNKLAMLCFTASVTACPAAF